MRDTGSRAKDARSLAMRWARGLRSDGPTLDDGLLLAEAFPGRIAKARGGPGEFQLANGRGAYVDPADHLAREPWLAVAELGGGGTRDRILSAARLDETSLLSAFAGRITVQDEIETDEAGRILAQRIRRLGRIVIDRRRLDNPDPAMIEAALLANVRAQGLASLPWGEASDRLRARVDFLRSLGGDWPDLSDEALADGLEDWLAPALTGKSRVTQINPGDLHAALRAMIPWDAQARLDVEAPEVWAAPTGTRAAIDYAAEGGPRIEIRVQELFGLNAHPSVAGGRVPLTLALLSPARRPIQTTKDLPGFWKGSWTDVRKDMRGRYPRHPWPEDPAAAPPTTRVKPRGT